MSQADTVVESNQFNSDQELIAALDLESVSYEHDEQACSTTWSFKDGSICTMCEDVVTTSVHL